MDASALELSSLSEEELRQKLAVHGIAAGPITETTRRLLERKLLRILCKESDNIKDCSEDTTGSTTVVETGNIRNVINDVSEYHAFYGVAVPQGETVENEDPESRIFVDQKSALKMVKQIPGARFKVFPNKEDAVQFASQPAATVVSQPTLVKPVVGESSEFRGPKVPELSKFRHLIEKGAIDAVDELVWSNPRYLISAGDTPVILQEGCRYNALHVCSLKNQPAIATFILDTLEDEAFMGRLYPLDSQAARVERIRHLVDLYLNMPDKGNCESPLHFACKFGHVDMVEALLERPATDRQRKNIRGDTPKQIICTRAGEKNLEVQQEICDMLEANCYVPLLRPADKSSVATVGHPWSPSDPELVTSNNRLAANPANSPLALDAFAGPMSLTQAERFRKKWAVQTTAEDRQRFMAICCQDDEKGLERIGRMLAQEEGVEWREYWEFLEDFVDLSSTAGLKLLDSYLERLSSELRMINLNSSALSETVVEEQPNQALQDSFEEKLTSLAEQFAMMVIKSPSPKKRTPKKPVRLNITDDNNLTEEALLTKPTAKQQIDLHLVHLEKSILPPSPLGNVTDSSSLAPVTGDEVGSDAQKASSTLLPAVDLPSSDSPSAGDSGCDSDTSLDTYYTATESPPASPPTYDCHTPPKAENLIFVFGNEPTKVDSDVLRALDPSNITPEFPNVIRWHRQVTAYSEDTRNRWASPRRDRPWSTTPRPGLRTGRQGQTPLSTKPQSPRLQGIKTNLMKVLSDS